MNILNLIQKNDIRTLKYILKQRQRSQPNLIEKVDRYGNTSLLKACYLGNQNIVQLLLRHKANVYAVNYFGQNALTLATYSGNLSLINLLLCYRSYEDFNKTSIVPAMAVAILKADKLLIEYFSELSEGGQAMQLRTAHGLSIRNLIEIQLAKC